MNAQFSEEGGEVGKFLWEEGVCFPAVVEAEPVFSVDFFLEEVTSVLQAEEIGGDEVHGNRVPDLVDFDAIRIALRC